MKRPRVGTYLFGRAEDMGVILLKTSDPSQAGEGAGELVAM